MAVNFPHNALMITSLVLLTHLYYTSALVHADSTVGFTIELIHRDSPISPFFNPSESMNHRVSNSLKRSIGRADRLTQGLSSAQSSLLASGDGDYLMKLLVGTPPVEVLAVADTSSGLTWVQCKSCSVCYRQASPLFDPDASSTYRRVACSSSQCQSLPTNICLSNTCVYRVASVAGISAGLVSVDTVTLETSTQVGQGLPLSFPNTTIGCGIYNVEGSGVVGLGPGASSLLYRMQIPLFSYCLVPSSSSLSSKLNFGSRALFTGPGVVSTPLASDSPILYYYVTMEGMSIGGEKIEFGSSRLPIQGNTMIDSGSALTYLPEEFYHQLESKVSNLIHLQRFRDPTHNLSLCYKTDSDIMAPAITVHFTGGDVELSSLNTFIRTDTDVVCFAFAPISGNDGSAIYGNIQQLNFLVSFDVERGAVSFMRTDCAGF